MKTGIFAICLVLLCGAWGTAAGQSKTENTVTLVDKEVSFTTSDGWKIFGTMSIPADLAAGAKVPGVVLVHSPNHDQDIYYGGHQVGVNTFAKENLRTDLGDIITLRIDIRGRGKSIAPQEYHSFTEEQKEKVALDIAGAIGFLGTVDQVDPNRIGVVSEGLSVEPAVAAAFKDPHVRAMVLLSGHLTGAGKELIAGRNIPVLCLASKEDRIGTADMAEAYKMSPSTASDLMVLSGVGTGNSMFIMSANKYPNQKSLESTVADWLAEKLEAGPQEVSFKTDDGWTLYGTIRIPRGTDPKGVPGIILLHSYLTDRHVFDNLEQMLTDQGIAVLNFDFRGRGESQAKGNYFKLSMEERDKAYLDAKAALDFLGSQKGVNPERLAVLGSSIGTKYGLKAAVSDPRVKAFVMMGGMPDPPDVQKSTMPILYVSSTGLPPIAKAFQGFYKQTQNHGSTLFEYDVGSVGYQIFDLDENLQTIIVKWLRPILTMQ